MASYKIVQNLGQVSYTASSSLEGPLALKSGYLRIANSGQFLHVAIGTDITATVDDFGIPANQSEVLKERVSSQTIVGVTTGTTTQIDAPVGLGQPFIVGDYVAISGATPAGINTNWARVNSIYRGFDRNNGGPSERMVVDWDTTSVTGTIDLTSAEVRRSVKIALFGGGSATAHISEVQIAGN